MTTKRTFKLGDIVTYKCSCKIALKNELVSRQKDQVAMVTMVYIPGKQVCDKLNNCHTLPVDSGYLYDVHFLDTSLLWTVAKAKELTLTKRSHDV